VYGIGKARSVEEWRTLARSLLHQGLLGETHDGYSVLSLNELSWQVLRGERPFQLAKAPQAARTRAPAAAASTSADGEALFERLRTLRKQLATTQGLPPYVIFHDATLREIVEQRPQTLQQFAGIRGVGEGKLARYGEQFIALLREHGG
jgi:ATP-dependent DNA helicase RecQ